jgi:hypothetical protein
MMHALAVQVAMFIAIARYYQPKINGWIIPPLALVMAGVLVFLDSTGHFREDIKLALFSAAEAVGGVRLLQLAAEKMGASMPPGSNVVVGEAKSVVVSNPPPPPTKGDLGHE